MIIAKVDCVISSTDGTDITFKEFATKFREFLTTNGYEFEGSVIKGYSLENVLREAGGRVK